MLQCNSSQSTIYNHASPEDRSTRAACRSTSGPTTSRQEALQQLVNVAQLPIVHSHVAAMPDVHVGIGATVGCGDPDQGRDHPGGRRRRHRLRHDARCASRSRAADLPDNLGRAARGDRGAPCRSASASTTTRDARGSRARGRSPSALDRHRRQASRRSRRCSSAFDATWVQPARHARRRQPLHRGLPRRGGPRSG